MSDFNSLVQYTVENISRPVKYIIYKLTEFIRVVDKFVFRQVPTGAASGYATIEQIEGNTVKFNQLVQNGDFSNGQEPWTINSSSLSISDNIATLTSTSTNITARIQQLITAVLGHKYICSFEMWGTTTGTALCGVGGSGDGGMATISYTTSRTTYKFISAPSTLNLAGFQIRYNQEEISGRVIYLSYVTVIDLTAIFGAGNEPTTVADFEAWLAQNGLPSVADYNAGELLSVKMQSVKSVGFNQWDEEWELGFININGELIPRNDSIRSKNFNVCFPSTNYYLYVGNTYSYGVVIKWYDSLYGYIGSTTISEQNTTILSPINAHYFKISKYSSGNTYNHDICINLSDPAKNGTYKPYQSDSANIDVTTITGINPNTNTREVMFPNDMKQADREGTVKDTLDLLSDTATVNVGSRAYQSGDESDTAVITDGTTTYYALTTPIEYTDLQDANGNPLNPRYKVEQGGTEQVLPVNTTHTLCDQTQLIANSDYGYDGDIRTKNGRYATPKINVRNLTRIKISYTADTQLYTAYCIYNNQSLVDRNTKWLGLGTSNGVLDVSTVDEVSFFFWYSPQDASLPTISALAVDTIPPTTVAPTLTTTYTKDNN